MNHKHIARTYVSWAEQDSTVDALAFVTTLARDRISPVADRIKVINSARQQILYTSFIAALASILDAHHVEVECEVTKGAGNHEVSVSGIELGTITYDGDSFYSIKLANEPGTKPSA